MPSNKTKTFKYIFDGRLDLSLKSHIFNSHPLIEIFKLYLLTWGKGFCLEVNTPEENWRTIAS